MSQSQSTRYFCVSLSPHCWCTRFDDWTAINNFEKVKGSTKRKKKSVWSLPQLFLSETVAREVTSSAGNSLFFNGHTDPEESENAGKSKREGWSCHHCQSQFSPHSPTRSLTRYRFSPHLPSSQLFYKSWKNRFIFQAECFFLFMLKCYHSNLICYCLKAARQHALTKRRWFRDLGNFLFPNFLDWYISNVRKCYLLKIFKILGIKVKAILISWNAISISE